MCGLAGFLGYRYLSPEVIETTALRMGEVIRHRGPDDAGVWRDDAAEVAMVHRRLSIQDLSPAGHQPMVSHAGRYVMVFNGEIYNHLDLRRALADHTDYGGVAWRGHSDTETLLAAIEAWGVEAALGQAVGMFALALWDRQERLLILARDRIGEKPLYYGWQRGVFLFGSELKALAVHPAFVGSIDRDALALQMRHNYIPAPHTIYQGIHKLLPGHFLRIILGRRDKPEVPRTYWSFPAVVAYGQSEPFSGGDAEAITRLESLLRNAVAQQQVADVPLGAFLSGGVDSSTIVALMQSQSSRPVKTFTIGFHEKGYNEAEHALAVARHLGTDHTELYVTPRQALDVIPHLPRLYDEPFSDSSQIPTYLVSEMTRNHVKVSLSGDGGDEFFGGYNRYLQSMRFWRQISSMPLTLRKLVCRGIRWFSPDMWNGLLELMQWTLPRRWRMNNWGDKLHKGADLFDCNNFNELYLRLISHWDEPEDFIIGVNKHTDIIHQFGMIANAIDGVERMMALDAVTYLPDDILVKIDRAAMGVSLETRVPMLDHRVIEFAWRLPISMKIRNGQSKWILRQILFRYVPHALIERPKMGFAVPIDSWLRGPLRDWAESLLDESRLRQEGYLNPSPIRKKWLEHLSGSRNWQSHLWDVLMFQAWLENSRA